MLPRRTTHQRTGLLTKWSCCESDAPSLGPAADNPPDAGELCSALSTRVSKVGNVGILNPKLHRRAAMAAVLQRSTAFSAEVAQPDQMLRHGNALASFQARTRKSRSIHTSRKSRAAFFPVWNRTWLSRLWLACRLVVRMQRRQQPARRYASDSSGNDTNIRPLVPQLR